MESNKEKFMKESENTKMPSFVYRDGMTADAEYVEWLSDVKIRFRQCQIKAAIRVNTTMLEFYWSIGRDLVALRAEERWGAGVVKQFALDMRQAFPDATGFSLTNVKYMKRWYLFYNEQDAKSQRAVDQLGMPEIFGQVPWGQQMELQMPGGQTFFPDLVFYHIPQHRYVVVELKAVKFIPEFAGKLNFYVTAADKLLRGEGDNPSVGLLICKSTDKTIVEWSLQDIQKPLGVASYQLQEVVERTIAELENMKKHDDEEI